MLTILGAAIGNCVHVGGLHHFLKQAESAGYRTKSLGPAVSLQALARSISEMKPDIVAISYRLTATSAKNLFEELGSIIASENIRGCRFIFGGTPPAAKEADDSGLFEMVFNGTEDPSVIDAWLHGDKKKAGPGSFPSSLVSRINHTYPYPVIRHHFGRPSLSETIEGASLIAESGLVDIISLGPDQNAQEFFFNPASMNHELDGAGGVPLRKPEDMRAIYEATRRGNFPLLRCYSGTRDLIRWAEMSVETINNAWAAVPLCWYSVMDGRSKRTMEEAMREHQEVMKWYADKNIPVEVNESHQWSLRDAHDSLAVAMAFLAAYNARKMGVSHYVSQFMFNNPAATSPEMDIAKMLAKNEMIERLSSKDFTVFREVRAGLAHFSGIPSFAKGQLAASAVVGMALKPHIYHVVGYSEADHAIFPDELIESCNIVHGALHNTMEGMPDLTTGSRVSERKSELVREADLLLDRLREWGQKNSDDPWADPEVLSQAISTGILDTPHFCGNPYLKGTITTAMIEGACYAIDEATGRKLGEEERIQRVIGLR